MCWDGDKQRNMKKKRWLKAGNPGSLWQRKYRLRAFSNCHLKTNLAQNCLYLQWHKIIEDWENLAGQGSVEREQEGVQAGSGDSQAGAIEMEGDGVQGSLRSNLDRILLQTMRSQREDSRVCLNRMSSSWTWSVVRISCWWVQLCK